MGRLDLSLLGTPQVRHAGQVLAFPTRKVLALLIYLVVEGGLHSREKLTALFWPESDDGRARTSFRRALALLRQGTAKALCRHIFPMALERCLRGKKRLLVSSTSPRLP